MDVRAETSADIDAIHKVHQQAFPTDAEAQLVDALRAAGNLAISLLAEVDGDIAGHLALSPVTIDGAEIGLGLAPVAVVPKRQRGGIGSMLVRQVLDVCRADEVRLVVVLGDPGYYSRFGFVPASRYGLQDTYGGGDAFQVILLDSRLRPPSGIARYAPEFFLFD